VGLSYDETNWLAAGASLKVVGVQFEKSSSQLQQGSVAEKNMPNPAYQRKNLLHNRHNAIKPTSFRLYPVRNVMVSTLDSEFIALSNI
jgi:hypothetical protein